jgi:hypothetical protein
MAIPLIAGTRSCQVDQGRASLRGTLAPSYITYVSPSNVPPEDLMTIQVESPKLPSTGTLTVIQGTAVSGPVLVRAHRVDRSGAMRLAGSGEVDLDAGRGPKRSDVRYAADTPGCYAIQFDGARFTEAAVLQVVAPYSAPPLSPGPTPAVMTPTDAATTVRASVTSISPVLLPTAGVGSNWRAQVTTGLMGRDYFSVTYTDPSGSRAVTVAAAQANLPLPTARGTQSHPAFHGDQRSLYQVSDSSDPRSARILMWREPGTSPHPDPSYPGVDYFVAATGLTDDEFWQLANSLR